MDRMAEGGPTIQMGKKETPAIIPVKAGGFKEEGKHKDNSPNNNKTLHPTRTKINEF